MAGLLGMEAAVSFANVVAGTYDIRIRYHAGGEQDNDVVVNDGATTWSAVFPGTGSSWGIKTLSGVTLAAGTNTVAIVKDWGWIDVDYIEIAPAASP
ncbi:MAG: CBM35 domain-containing protein [Isosphaeraceae bacterium]